MNYKVKVNNEAESREVQLLGEKLGYVKPQPPSYISMKNGGYVCLGFNYDGVQEKLILLVGGFKESDMSDIQDYKELTISQLKDLVVLKRNSIDDATHKSQSGFRWFVTSDNKIHSYSNKQWVFISDDPSDLQDLKPIINPLKEYLVPQGNGKYALTKATEKRVSYWIEVPDGMNFAHKDEFNIHFTKLEMGYRDSIIVWQRHTQPEELPFVDDEPKIETATGYQLDVIGQNTYGSRSRNYGEADEDYRNYLMCFVYLKPNTNDAPFDAKPKSLNDTYAEIEQVRQDALSIQVGGNHYKNLAIQPVEFAMQNNLDFCQANAIKYIVRHADKNGKDDLLKAKHYIDLLIQHYYTEGTNQ